MDDVMLDEVSIDLLSIPPLIFRILRKRLLKATLADIDVDIKYPHFEILRLLDEEGMMPVAKIGEQLEIAKAQMTHLIDRLVQLELAERIADATDRRIININLTEKGKGFVKEEGHTILKFVREYISSLETAELETLGASLRCVRDTLLKLQPGPCQARPRDNTP